ncbi:MAG: response regulator [Lachnospiraceae bacterium]|nr:response regulator [Lachnospiraceae bacterium]
MKFTDKLKFTLNVESLLYIVFCVVINLVGKFVSIALNMPFWLDSTGTVVSSCILGPLAGSLVAIISGVLQIPIGVHYVFCSIAGVGVAFVVSYVYPRKYDVFSIVGTSIVSCIVSTVLSIPVNYVFMDGRTGNMWGDAMFDMLSNTGAGKGISAFFAELFVDFPDKVLVMFLASGIIFIIRKSHEMGGLFAKEDVEEKKKEEKKEDDSINSYYAFFIPLLTAAILFSLVHPVYAASDDKLNIYEKEDLNSEYNRVIYNSETGMNCEEINVVEQTSDEYIWVGSYSGLYRFDGKEFEEEHIDNRIKNVKDLYSDSQGNMWIATNDGGIFCYEMPTGEVSCYDVERGLPSNSVRCIAEDKDHNIYVGTATDMAMISPVTGKVTVFSSLADISVVKSLIYSKATDTVAGVTNNGIVFFMRHGRVIYKEAFDMDDREYTSISEGYNGEFLIGTSKHIIRRVKLVGSNLVVLNDTDDENIGAVNTMKADNLSEKIFVCADKGIGILDNEGNYRKVETAGFDSSISDMIRDKQGNIWITSSKLGVCKMSKNPFVDIFTKAGIKEHVVNVVAEREGLLYIGTDDGLYIVNSEKYYEVRNRLTRALAGERIRHILKDSNNGLWISTYNGMGEVHVSADDAITTYTESEDQTLGNRFRSAIELSDGRILLASTTGLTFIKNERVEKTLGENEGITMPQILSLYQKKDGTIMAGSDGGGVYVIKDDKVVDVIDEDDGLKSLVVMRIVPYDSGFFYVTSSALFYEKNNTIIKLDKFPYSNNYDISINGEEAWIMSSAGIYIVNIRELIKNEDYGWRLLNRQDGLDGNHNSNSWDYKDAGRNLYICLANGVRRISLNDYDRIQNDYNVMIYRITADGEDLVPVSRDGNYLLPINARRVEIEPAILNYTLTDPIVHMYLEGFDDEGVTMLQSECDSVTYTNIPTGSYNFHLQIIDAATNRMIRDLIVPITKEAHLYEQFYFKAYMFFVLVLAVFSFTWLIAKYGSISVIRDQYDQIRDAKEDADKANQAKSRFLANMSHEIRTPINTIMGMDELILREDVSDEVRGYANDIHNASVSLLSIINDILDISKIESGRMNIVERDYGVERLLKEVCKMTHVNAEAKDLDFITDFGEDIPSVLFGDDVRISQVLLNILSNAVKYTDEGTITFSVHINHVDGDEAFITYKVTDTGMGIREGDLDKIFTSFERLDERRNAHIQGTGLGLNITRQLLILMGSDVQVESKYGQGSTFSFTLKQKIVESKPIGHIVTESKPVEKNIKYEPVFSAQDAVILVVDDNNLNLEVVKGLLKTTGIQIDTAHSGSECLDKITLKHYDVILLDHMMPEMDGMETLERIRNHKHLCNDTPVIALTANAISGMREKYIEAGFSDYLSKPVTGKDLETVLNKFLPEDKLSSGDNKAEDIKKTESDKETAEENVNYVPVHMNMEDAMTYCGGDKEFVVTIAEVYTEDAPEKTEMLKTHYKNRNWKDFSVEAHALKSSSRTLGLNELADLAYEMEKAGKAEDEEKIHKGYGHMMKLYAEVVKELQLFLKNSR